MIAKRQTVDSQLNENKTVLEELGKIPEDAKVFKLTGPVLAQVDLFEAKENVNSRINKFDTTINRAEMDIKRVNEAINKKRDRMVNYQQFFQQIQLEQMRSQQEQQQKLIQRAQQRANKGPAKPPQVKQAQQAQQAQQSQGK